MIHLHVSITVVIAVLVTALLYIFAASQITNGASAKPIHRFYALELHGIRDFHGPGPSDLFNDLSWRTRYAVGSLVMGAITTYFLMNKHRAHFLGTLSFLLLLACTLMDVFTYHGHGGRCVGCEKHHHHEDGSASTASAPVPSTNAGKQQ